MTVAELMIALNSIPQDAKVIIDYQKNASIEISVNIRNNEVFINASSYTHLNS